MIADLFFGEVVFFTLGPFLQRSMMDCGLMIATEMGIGRGRGWVSLENVSVASKEVVGNGAWNAVAVLLSFDMERLVVLGVLGS